MTLHRNLDLHLLECFELLVQERSVSRAADRLAISQSSASETLARLREKLGDPLLVRTREGMVPTPRALSLLPQVKLAIEQLRHIIDPQLGFEPGQAKEKFSITATDYAQLLLMPGLARSIVTAAPACSLDLVTVNIRHVEQALETGGVDLAIAYYPEPPPSLRRGPLFSDRYVCVARKDHPKLQGELSAADFAALGHVNVSPSGLSYFSNSVDAALDVLGLVRHVVVTCPHFMLASYLVSQSDMVLSLPRQAGMALTSFFPLQMVEIPLKMKPVDVAMYWHERCHHSVAQQWIRDQVRQVMQKSNAHEG